MAITDAFTRANETPLAAPWVKALAAGGDFNLTSNAVVPAAGTDSLWLYSGTFANDQYAQAAVAGFSVLNNETGPGVAVRVSTGSGGSGYWAVVNQSVGTSTDVYVSKWVNGSYTAIATRTEAFSDGDILKLEVAGTTLKVSRNGSQLGADITDADIATGNPGIAYSSTAAAAVIDTFECTDVVAGAARARLVGGKLVGDGLLIGGLGV